MTRNLLTVLCVGAGLLLASPPGFAHHSASGEFDNSKPLEFTGTVKTVEWVNPHGYVQVDVKDETGKLVTYRVEIMAPNGLYRAGWTKNSVKPGQTVSFKGHRAKNPESMNVSGRLTLDGKPLFTSTEGDRRGGSATENP
jgi:hypothetical protein